MGLDITVLGKPLPGHEAEFHRLLIALAVDGGLMPDPNPRPKPGFLKRLMGHSAKMSEAERQAKMTRMAAIEVPAFQTLGAPVVGQDAAADLWVADLVRIRDPAATDAVIEHEMREMAGFHVLPLLPPCDGLRAYSNGGAGYDADETSFRGEVLKVCGDLLPRAEVEAAWGLMLAPDLLAYGRRVQAIAATYAATHGLTDQLGQLDGDFGEAQDRRRHLHIIDSLARWSIFWGGRGHGAYPYF